jgi:hypothetical protein
MDIIPAVAGNKTNINSAEFVKLTIYNDVANTADTSVYTFSSAYKAETIDGQVYTPLGGLLGVGIQQRDIRVTSADTSISLSGIDGNNIAIVLATKVRGSELEIIRGFYDSNFNLSNTAHRFTGIVTSYNLAEERHDLVDNFTVTINASSYKSVLENRIAGRKTNTKSWQQFDPTDSSMNNIYSLSDQHFDFGMPVTRTAATTSTAANDASSSATNTGTTEGGGP